MPAAAEPHSKDRILDATRVTAREDTRVCAELEVEVVRLNVGIDRYNAMVPAESLRLMPVRAAALLASGS